MLLPRSPAARPRQSASISGASRFSPLTAPQRAFIDSFLSEARPWAERQARRAYRHLPAELHEQALDQASVALRTGAPSELDRRALYANLAERLDEELRRIHVGWCLNQARASVAAEPAPSEPTTTTRHPVTGFIEDSLGGLERAVLQLELGAGRKSHTVRAALRLGPRQYGRHRELGLGKLRGAIAGGLNGQVCAQHLEAVTLAATGDRDAADRLSTGPDRCRACAREAAGLRRILQQRLALAPWPFAIKPAGLLAAKVGALGALFGGKGAAGGGTGLAGLAGTSSAGGAKVVAAVIATAAVASGGIAAVQHDSSTGTVARSAAAVTQPMSKPATAARTAAATTVTKPATTRRHAKHRKSGSVQEGGTSHTAATAAPATTAGSGAQNSASTNTATAPAKPADPVRNTVDRVKKTVDSVTGKLPVKVPTVDELAPGLGQTVDQTTGAINDLLSP